MQSRAKKMMFILAILLSQYGMAETTYFNLSPFDFSSHKSNQPSSSFETGIHIGSQNNFISPHYDYTDLKSKNLCIQNLDTQLSQISHGEKKSLARRLTNDRKTKLEAKIKLNIYGREFASPTDKKITLIHVEVMTFVPDSTSTSSKKVTIIIPIDLSESCDSSGLIQSLHQAIYHSQNDSKPNSESFVYDLKTLQKEVYAKNNDRILEPIPASYQQKSHF